MAKAWVKDRVLISCAARVGPSGTLMTLASGPSSTTSAPRSVGSLSSCSQAKRCHYACLGASSTRHSMAHMKVQRCLHDGLSILVAVHKEWRPDTCDEWPFCRLVRVFSISLTCSSASVLSASILSLHSFIAISSVSSISTRFVRSENFCSARHSILSKGIVLW